MFQNILPEINDSWTEHGRSDHFELQDTGGKRLLGWRTSNSLGQFLWQLYTTIRPEIDIKNLEWQSKAQYLGHIACTHPKRFHKDCIQSAKTLDMGEQWKAAIGTYFFSQGFKGVVDVNPMESPLPNTIGLPHRLKKILPISQTIIYNEKYVAMSRQIFKILVPNSHHEYIEWMNRHPGINIDTM